MKTMDGLKLLYGSMRKQSIDRAKFDVKYNSVTFKMIYFIDSTPHMLAIGVQSHNFYFELPVKPGFKINTLLGDIYGELCTVLGLTRDPLNPFSTNAFFEQIDMRIPHQINQSNVANFSDVVPFRKDVEEADKIYFLGWAVHQGKTNATPENLEKTRKWLGESAYITCKKRNISSKWTDDFNKSKTVNDPPIK